MGFPKDPLGLNRVNEVFHIISSLSNIAFVPLSHCPFTIVKKSIWQRIKNSLMSLYETIQTIFVQATGCIFNNFSGNTKAACQARLTCIGSV